MEKIITFNNTFSGRKVLITGNTGFKGSWLTLWLLKAGAEIVGISDEIPTNPSLFEVAGLEKRITHYYEDVRNSEQIKEIVLKEQPDFIFHLAAQAIVSKSYKDPLHTFSTNVMGTASVFNALRHLQKKCVAVFITSDKAYENVEWPWGYKETDHLGGKDIYSASKAAAENVIHSFFYSFTRHMDNIRIASARAGNVIGGGDWAADRIVPDCMRAWSKKEAVSIRSPKATRPWQHVLEPLSGYLRLAEFLWQDDKLNGESFNFGPPSEITLTVEEILRELSKHWKYEDSSEAYKITDNKEFHEAGLLKLNCDKALFHLKWSSNLRPNELLEFTGQWYYEFYHGNTDMYEYTLQQINQYETKAKERNLKWVK